MIRVLAVADIHRTRLAFLAASMLLGPAAAAQESAEDGDEQEAEEAEATARVSLGASPRRGPIRIDGVLDEPDWQRAEPSSNFIERLPTPRAEPPVRTEVRVLVDRDAVYVAVTSFLAEGEVPRALNLTRDSFRIWSDDAVTLKFDVRRDRRSTMGFAVNPAGAQLDFIGLDNGRTFRIEQDSVWEVGTSTLEDRWIAEFRIPSAALGVPPGTSARIFGFNVSRDHNARQATYDLNHIPPEFGAASAMHYGDLDGLAGLGGGRPLIAIPYLLGFWPGREEWDLPIELKAGGEIRLRLADDIWGELTFLTDFAEVDLDSQIVNLDRFPLFFPERRPFFLSGLDVFQFGAPGEAQLFFTRRIGLDSEALPVPIYGGIKLYGREGPISFGFLDVSTGATVNQPAANWGVARVRANIGQASYVGALFGSRANLPLGAADTADFDAQAHYMVGIDGLARALDGRFEINGFAAYTYDDRQVFPLAPAASLVELVDGAVDTEEPAEGYAGRLELRWRGTEWMPVINALYIPRGFSPELGFIRRSEIFQSNVSIPWLTRTPAPGIRRLQFGAAGRLTMSDDFEDLLRLSGGWSAEIETDDRWVVAASGSYLQDVVRESFEPSYAPDMTIEAGEYRGVIGRLEMRSPFQRNPNFGISITAQNAFFGGAAYQSSISFSTFIGPHFRTSIAATGALIAFARRRLIPTLALNSLFSVTPSPQLVIDVVAQINSVADEFIGMARIRWRYLPGSDLFLVYREQLAFGGPELESERRITLKISYRYDASL